jgi:hypothetical protein
VFEAILWCLVLTAQPSEMVIRLTVDPMPAPKPALRYLLLPDLKEQSPGNPIPHYMKCLLDQDFTDTQDTLGSAALRQADRAARMDKPDWQILHKIRTDGVNLLLPDLQKMRAIATALQTRFREEITLGRFDDALVTAKTMFALSRHTGEHPCLIGNLVGIAIAFVGITPLEEMLEKPGCPNLYWALTNLPNPFISLDKGLEGERMIITAELKELDDKNPMAPEQLKKLIERIDMLRGLNEDKVTKTTRLWLFEHGRDDKYMAAARGRLVEYGIPEERLNRFPSMQVLFLDEKLTYEIERDEAMKIMNLPTWEVVTMFSKSAKPRDREQTLFGALVPAMQRVRYAQGRLEQRFAMLRHIEAIRMYAADHEGKLPAKLSDVSVPLPVDPFTGKPFLYEVKDGTAHLRGTPPPGYLKFQGFNIHYEITIRK